MKKLGRLKLNPEKLLSHDELVSFKGGSGSGTCGWTGGGQYDCCVSKAEALFMYGPYAGQPGANWCCDSCSTTWYCGGVIC